MNIYLKNNSIIFAFTGSDKLIYVVPIRNDEHIQTDLGPHVAAFDCLRVDKPLSIVRISTNCVAIFGGNKEDEGASLILYNTRYYMLQWRQQYKVLLDECRLQVIGKYIFVARGHELSCAEFRIHQQTLSDMIGSKRSREYSGIVNKDSINEEDGFDEFPKVGYTDKQPYKNRNACEIDFVRGDSLQTKVGVHVNDRLYHLPETTSLTEILEKHGAGESELSEQVIPLLIKANLPDELATCLRKYTTVSEQMLAKSLKFFINMDDSDAKSDYINRVLACSFNIELIKEPLRTNLNLENVIYLLGHIHQGLQAEENWLDESPQYGHEFDEEKALISWFSVILDAHYQQFILARDRSLIAMINEWKTSIETTIHYIRDFKSLTAILRNLTTGGRMHNSRSSKCYSVELKRLY